ncbi:MAG: hypothetical protein AAF611_13005 [Bacteroidota bacterium]
MRQFVVALFLMLYAPLIAVTACAERFIIEEHINLYLCQNYSNYNETTTLLFKARAKVLNEYIATKIKDKQLQDKTFEIQLYDGILSLPHLELTQGAKGYFVSLSGFPSLEKLRIIIDYFSMPNWHSFSAESNATETIDVVIDNFLWIC